MIRENKSKEKIIKWFKMVCEGIRLEYEQGASYRKLEVDITTLKELLLQNRNYDKK